MAALDLVMLIALIGAAVMWFLYVIEAFKLSLVHGFLLLLVQAYVFHFAFIRSEKGLPSRMVLLVCVSVFLAGATIRVALLGTTG